MRDGEQDRGEEGEGSSLLPPFLFKETGSEHVTESRTGRQV